MNNFSLNTSFGLPKRGLALRALARLIMVSVLAVVLWFGSAFSVMPTAQANTHSQSKAYENGPMRQSRNPISGENFNGGVDQSATNKGTTGQPAEQKAEGILEIIGDKLSGSNSNQAPADLNVQNNRPLEKYGAKAE